MLPLVLSLAAGTQAREEVQGQFRCKERRTVLGRDQPQFQPHIRLPSRVRRKRDGKQTVLPITVLNTTKRVKAHG